MLQEIQTNLTLSDIAQRILTLQGNPYSLENYPMFVQVLNSRYPRRLMRSGRQVSKTTIMAADMVSNITICPYKQVIYCNSSSAQTASFSTSKLAPFIQQSPYVYHNIMKGKNIIDNVYNKRMANFSEIIMSYFSESADRIRGRSGQDMYLDEVQDMLWDAMIDAEECLSAAPKPRFTYAGTSKSLNTPLEFLWSESTQNEWIIKCQGCSKYNRPSVKNIGLKGLICKNCGHSLNPFDGRWHSFGDKEKPFADGYWIPQIIMPMHCLSEEKWKLLLTKREVYPETKFDNEVMGLPNGEGESPITEEMLQKICDPNMRMLDRVCEENASGAAFIAAGIDWGGGGELGVSRTVLSIYAVYPEQPLFRKIFGKIYTEGEPVRHVADIAMWLTRFNVRMACGDHGGGNFAMSALAEKTPPHISLIPVMYSDAGSPYRWDEHSRRYTVNRTAVIDAFFTDLKKGVIEAFRWEEFRPFAMDILNVKQEVLGEDRGISKRVWRHSPRKPDDSLHSMVFGWFACRVLSGRMDFAVLNGNGYEARSDG